MNYENNDLHNSGRTGNPRKTGGSAGKRSEEISVKNNAGRQWKEGRGRKASGHNGNGDQARNRGDHYCRRTGRE